MQPTYYVNYPETLFLTWEIHKNLAVHFTAVPQSFREHVSMFAPWKWKGGYVARRDRLKNKTASHVDVPASRQTKRVVGQSFPHTRIEARTYHSAAAE